MSLQVNVPEVGESITEVTIASWLKKEGDYVEQDEIIAELESDKATFELPAEAAGILHIKASEGDTVEVGALLCEIDTDQKGSENKKEAAPEKEESKEEAPKNSAPEEEKKEEAPKSSTPSAKSAEVREMVVPSVGESITEVTISSWLKKDGDQVALDEIIAEVESDKATFELPAEASGILKIVAKEGDTLEIGALICKIEVTEGGSAKSAPEKDEPTEDKKESSNEDVTYATGHASPAAAKIIKERGLDPSQISGTGVDGRITKEDAMTAQTAPKEEAKPSKPTEKSPDRVIEKDHPQSRGERREKMSSLRKTISRRLVSVKNETAMLTTFNEVNMQPVMEIRKKYKDSFKEKYGVGLGFMSFFTKAICQALKEWPSVNASIDGEEIVYHEFCDISIAVSTPKGLVVPVIRNAEQMNFEEIEKEIIRLAGKARDGKLSIEEMTGGTFTITNGGIFGSMLSTPIINAPQSAILGMHNIVERAVVENGEIVVRPIMYVALSYDHRIVDGRESVSFLYRVKELLEDPARIMIGV